MGSLRVGWPCRQSARTCGPVSGPALCVQTLQYLQQNARERAELAAAAAASSTASLSAPAPAARISLQELEELRKQLGSVAAGSTWQQVLRPPPMGLHSLPRGPGVHVSLSSGVEADHNRCAWVRVLGRRGQGCPTRAAGPPASANCNSPRPSVSLGQLVWLKWCFVDNSLYTAFSFLYLLLFSVLNLRPTLFS